MRPGEASGPNDAVSLYGLDVMFGFELGFEVREVTAGGGSVLETRMLDGNVEMVGVAGRTLTEVCGERAVRGPGFMADVASERELEVEDVDEALEWLCTWWILRTEETDEEVDLRPRSPTDARL